MPRISLRIPLNLAAQIRVLAEDLSTTDSEAARLLLNRGLTSTSVQRLEGEIREMRSLLHALASEVSLISALAEEHAARGVAKDRREEYRDVIRQRKSIAENEIHALASQKFQELGG